MRANERHNISKIVSLSWRTKGASSKNDDNADDDNDSANDDDEGADDADHSADDRADSARDHGGGNLLRRISSIIRVLQFPEDIEWPPAAEMDYDFAGKGYGRSLFGSVAARLGGLASGFPQVPARHFRGTRGIFE